MLQNQCLLERAPKSWASLMYLPRNLNLSKNTKESSGEIGRFQMPAFPLEMILDYSEECTNSRLIEIVAETVCPRLIFGQTRVARVLLRHDLLAVSVESFLRWRHNRRNAQVWGALSSV